ncbi:hypothetical protein SBI67_10230 [Mycolicibacterium sp. 120266]|uniref:hypothetical protein n=1 Tax=Mycolicibacterium sp. 120266 TaxID=3090601 RepID=UPI00299E2A49|nr:hypothetical protein [Mycolicibacterium sp. 120266]MDX1872499.1 hypothetical protein [Mycolicibacterium sp. 120266]
MESPRSGFRRAGAVSWALTGLGVAGVAGASTLAYADTFKPATPPPVEVALTAPDDATAALAVPDMAAEPDVQTPADPAPVLPPETTRSETTPPETTPPAPPLVTAVAPIPPYSPPSDEQPPAPSTRATHPPTPTTVTTSPSTTRRVPRPTTVNSPNYSPHITISRGS